MRLLEIGRVTKTRGLKGTLKVASFLAGNDALLVLKDVFITPAIATNPDVTSGLVELPPEDFRYYRVRKAHLHRGGFFFLDLEGIEDIGSALPLIGTRVLVPPSYLPPLPTGEYYWFELLGATIVSEQKIPLGKLIAIFPTGGNDVYVCRAGDIELLIPAVPECIVGIDIEAKTITVALPAGYEELWQTQN